MGTIDQFQGEYRWLSNFYPATIQVGDYVYPTVEHAYVAAKQELPLTQDEYAWFRTLTPGQVKRVGRQLDLRPDWETSKLDVMLELTRIKYSPANPDLQIKLRSTGTMHLIEGNTWGDTFWGVCGGKGSNWLGHIIMQVRDELN